MVNRLILTKIKEQPFIFSYENEELTGIDVFTETLHQFQVGDIYTARVKNILTNINAAFVDIGGNICYYSLEDNKHTIWLHSKETQTLKCNDEILVQIEREAVKTKQPSVTCYITIPGKYCVFTYQKTGVGISKKIKDTQKRERLKNLYSVLLEQYGEKEQFGVVVRTDAQFQTEKELQEDAVRTLELAKQIKTYAAKRTTGQCLYSRNDAWEVLFDTVSNCDTSEIITDIAPFYEILKEKQQQNGFAGKIVYYEKEIPLSVLYELKANLTAALAKEVWLPSGGYLVLEPCEALTVIDVNTGKSSRTKGAKEDHVWKVNLEATKMIAKQLRLRNYSGIILIDFIDMKNPEYNEKLLQEMRQLLRKDSIKTTLVDITALGLMELTRKKIKKPLHEQLKGWKME